MQDALGLEMLTAEFDCLGDASGSARLLQDGSCVVICGVRGPLEAPAKGEQAERASIAVRFVPASRQSDPSDRLWEAFLIGVAEQLLIASMHPRSLISVVLQEVGNCSLADAVNAMCLGLVDAAIPLTSIFYASQADAVTLVRTAAGQEVASFVAAATAGPLQLASCTDEATLHAMQQALLAK